VTPCQSAVGPASTPASGAPLQAQTPEIDALRAGAEQGDASAQSSLGIMYDYGGGVSEDDAVAVRWYQRVADQGHAGAQYSLGAMYATGRGVVQDYVQAHMWRNLAASRQTGEDRELSVEARDALADLMTPKISAKPTQGESHLCESQNYREKRRLRSKAGLSFSLTSIAVS